jgi:hypothetical protein
MFRQHQIKIVKKLKCSCRDVLKQCATVVNCHFIAKGKFLFAKSVGGGDFAKFRFAAWKLKILQLDLTDQIYEGQRRIEGYLVENSGSIFAVIHTFPSTDESYVFVTIEKENNPVIGLVVVPTYQTSCPLNTDRNRETHKKGRYLGFPLNIFFLDVEAFFRGENWSPGSPTIVGYTV